MLLTRAASTFMLLNSLVSVLVVDLSCFFVDKDLVSFSYTDELLFCVFVATRKWSIYDVEAERGSDVRVLVWVVFLAQRAVRFLDFTLGSILLDSK